MLPFLHVFKNRRYQNLYDIQGNAIEPGPKEEQSQKCDRKTYPVGEIGPLIYPPDPALWKKGGYEMDDDDKKAKWC